MRSRILVIVLAVAIGILLAFLHIWPWPQVREMCTLYGDGTAVTSHIWEWQFDSMVIFYLNILRQIEEGPISQISKEFIDIFLFVVYLLILIFLSWKLARRLQGLLIYLWDLP
jgi:hypothetical protein